MPMYSYKGQNARTGKKLKAYIEADSPKDAKQKLKKLDESNYGSGDNLPRG